MSGIRIGSPYSPRDYKDHAVGAESLYEEYWSEAEPLDSAMLPEE